MQNKTMIYFMYLQSPVPANGARSPIFYVPSGLLRILNRDLKFAGIPKKDDRGMAI